MSGPLPATDLAEVRRFTVPREVLDFTLEYLGSAGQAGWEAFVVWGGTRESAVDVRFTRALAPEQQSYRTVEGLLVSVSGDALFEVNRTLYESGEILAGQVHSHPGDAYHSDTDDHFPLVTLRGALSLVVPDFARGGIASMKRWAWYRLSGYGRWHPLSHTGTEIEIV